MMVLIAIAHHLLHIWILWGYKVADIHYLVRSDSGSVLNRRLLVLLLGITVVWVVKG